MGTSKSINRATPRVVIANDHIPFAQILSLTLTEAGMDVIDTALTGREAVEATLKHKPDIVLLDIALPVMDGLAALSIIKYNCPETAVFIITSLADPLYMARAGELGAEGFFSKSFEPDELINAIHGLLCGDKSSVDPKPTPELAGRSIRENSFPKGGSQSSSGQNLTEQERLILSFISMGLNNQSVMDKLHISKNTIKTHIRNIFSKLGVADRTQAAIWALQNGYGVQMPTGS